MSERWAYNRNKNNDLNQQLLFATLHKNVLAQDTNLYNLNICKPFLFCYFSRKNFLPSFRQ